jgi:hypothetical protein
MNGSEKRGSVKNVGRAHGMAISGSTAYVAKSSMIRRAVGSGLQIIDISDPSAPVLLSSYPTRGSAADVAVSGSLAYLALREAGLEVIDVSDPSTPVLRAAYTTPHQAHAVAVAGRLAFVDQGLGKWELLIVRATIPDDPIGHIWSTIGRLRWTVWRLFDMWYRLIDGAVPFPLALAFNIVGGLVGALLGACLARLCRRKLARWALFGGIFGAILTHVALLFLGAAAAWARSIP